ncbi:Fis family two component sigma-54 specific transcriptional regulator - like protein [Thioalkalivibrio nitratireducens DSM 14787]|uniref:Fis family two component sigma-54 specific transcriptional regulator-like protein n=1 Tax=Thioalkalivibrio nitratireducens (strain DSM 14787 / UNIQEM 213 / ALEN2) TaxID=1255043 RepID=L0DX25_THIND|nr:sigma-54 dependent transcriptional regulator [Thioalkalivibrio nitratireducens]AGA34159.1 Fis family two component sigma-54 specific transcriptional regulator - like protein [Thioalkalivibrio nitratireducens DSM 14787]
MSIKHVLVVDDEPDICELLEITLQRMGIDTTTTTRMTRTIELLEERRFDLCLTDMRMPDGDGLELVRLIQDRYPELPVAIITAHGSIDTAVQALKLGAFDFVTKPVDLNLLRRLIDSALRLGAGGAPESAQGSGEGAPTTNPLLGRSPAMVQLRNRVARLARSQAPVIILGESGSGKELVAREIHRLGPRAGGPFVPVNCGAIPAELMESEFFGHQKGAFTGAVRTRVGLFREAHGGTLLLDEVAELPLPLQVKLLRALQERAIKPVGASREEPVDVRILSATHRDLAADVAEGRFRQDLYYRLNVVELRVPPLRERHEDLEELARHILARIAGEWGIPGLSLSEDALARLRQHPFPGNVRELENILERAAVMVDGRVIDSSALDFPNCSRAGTGSGGNPATVMEGQVALDDHLAEQERRALEAALAQTAGNRTAAARVLGLSFRQMRYRLKKLGID